MMKLTIDLESRSEVDLKKAGMYVYAEHESTDILCLAFKVDEGTPLIWISKKFSQLLDKEAFTVDRICDEDIDKLIDTADIIEAHNASFEMIMWHEIMHKRYGFPDLPFEKIRCSAAKASAYALPRSLDYACKALNLSAQKDNTGYKIMLKMCKPRKPTKNNSAKWHEDPEDFKLLCEYCMKDVEAEYALSESLYDLSNEELEVWRIDQVINNRGMAVDIKGINSLIEKVQQKETELLLEIQKLTGGSVNSTRQTAATLEWLNSEKVEIENLQKETVKKVLDTDISETAKQLLRIRQSLAKSSVSKLDAMARMASKDNRVRGTMLYHGAATGRWAGKGIQPHNYPRDSYSSLNIDELVTLENDLIEILYDCPIQAASKCLRGMITATPGNKLFAADFSAIEARVLAWLACETSVLNSFKEGLDVYRVAASKIYKIAYEKIEKDSRERQIGKTIILACGYQGWIGAFRQMASKAISEMSDDEIKEVILAWREANQMITAFWGGLEAAAIQTVKTGKVHCYGRIKYGLRDNFLHCRLPSGRLLSYYGPSTEMITTKWGKQKEVISFMGVDSVSNKWTKQFSYGGKLTENVVQATSRDLLAEAILRLEKAGYPVVLHVHDEIVADLPENTDKTLKDFESIMSKVPSWAEGLPVKADGWEGFRYRKA